MKSLVFALFFVALCSAQLTFLGNFQSKDPKADLGQIFNGFWEYANLTDPTQAIECFDEDSANLTMVFIGTMLKQVAQQQVAQIPKTVADFEHAFPQAVYQCLAKDPEIPQLAVAYGVSDTPFALLQAQITKYIVTHIQTIHSQASTGYFYYIQGMYDTLGNLAGLVFAQMVKQSAEETNILGNYQSQDPKADLGQVFNGFWEYANLTDPTQAIECFDEDTANLTMVFIGTMLKQVAQELVAQIPKTISDFQHAFPQTVYQCLAKDPEVAQLAVAYGVADTPFTLLQAQIAKYILLHIKTLNSQASTGYFYYIQGMYNTLGNLGGLVFAQMVQKSTEAVAIDALTELQDVYNGLFEEAGLADPTTLISCYNETTAQITLDFFRDVIQDLSADKYLALVREYQIYRNTLPASLFDCLQNNDEFTSVFQAYGFEGETGKVLLQKYITFNIQHHFMLLNDTKTITQDIANADYNSAGHVFGQLILAIQGSAAELADMDFVNVLERVYENEMKRIRF